MSLEAFSDEVYEAIKAHVTANWTATPIRWPNEDFEEPEGAWLAFEMNGSLYGQQTIGMSQQGDNRWDREGSVWFHVMTRRGEGETGARGAALYLANLFRGRLLMPDESLEFFDAHDDPGETQGNWYRVTVTIEWRLWEA